MALGGGGGGGSSDIRAGGAYVEISAKDSLSKTLKGIVGSFMDFGKQVLSLTGIGGLLGGIAGGFGFKETADDLKKMDDVAKAFGITGRQASGLFGVLAAAGGEFKENLEGVIQFADTVDQALQGKGGQSSKLFDGLAITAQDINALPIDEKFYAVHEAIRGLPQPLQEAKLALIGGTDSMKQWQPLLSMSTEEVRQLAKDMAISTAELQDAAAASKAMAQAGAAANRMWQQVVITLSPLVKQGSDWLTGGLKDAAKWLEGRTLKDFWTEGVAWAKYGWEQTKQLGREAWADIEGFAVDAWYDTEAAAKVAWIDLVEWVDKVLSKDLWAGLAAGAAVQFIAIDKMFHDMLDGMAANAKALFAALALGLTNPVAAAAALGNLAVGGGFKPEDLKKAVDEAKAEVDKAGAGAGQVVLDGRQKALDEAGEKKLRAAFQRAAALVEGQGKVDEAWAEVERARAEVDANRKKRVADEEKPVHHLRDAGGILDSALGMFAGDAGNFLKQSFGPRTERIGDKIDKTNELLEDLVDTATDLAKRPGFVVT